jgi:hypothetical protein
MQSGYKEQIMQLKLQIEKEAELRAEAERQLYEWKSQQSGVNEEVCSKVM